MVNHLSCPIALCGLCHKIFIPPYEDIVTWTTTTTPLLSYVYRVCKRCRSYTLLRGIPVKPALSLGIHCVTTPLSDSLAANLYRGNWKYLDPDKVDRVPSRYYMENLHNDKLGTTELFSVTDLGEGDICLRSEHIRKCTNRLFWQYNLSKFFNTKSYREEVLAAVQARDLACSDRATFMYW